MRNLTKASRDASRAAQFESLLNNGYTRETYKGLDFFTKEDSKYFTLKVYWGNAANHQEYKNYHSAERRAEVMQNYKDNYDSRQAYKAEQKAKGQTSSHAGASAAIKAELQAAFKGVKFSVTSESYSGGNSVRISWTDGPTVAEVETISQKYQYGHFNGMEDIYEYSNDNPNLPQVKYVSESRAQSETVSSLIPAFSALFHPDQSSDYRNSPEQILYRIFVQTSFPCEYANLRIEKTGVTCGSFEDFYKLVFDTVEQVTEPQISPIEVKAGKIQVIEYGAGLAVVGDTKPIKDKLKELGGRFNFRLTCGAGWVFPKNKLELLQTALTA